MEGWQNGSSPLPAPMYKRLALLFEDRVKQRDEKSAVFVQGL